MNFLKNVTASIVVTSAFVAAAPTVQAAEVTAPINIVKTISFKGDFDRLKADFVAKEPLMKLMPNVESIKPTGQRDTWSYRMKPMGSMGVKHVTEYVSAYTYESQDNRLVAAWVSPPETGNAVLNGKAVYTRGANGEVVVNLVLKGSLNKIEVPAIYTLGAASVTRGIFESNMDQFLEALKANYGG
jgi:hypothetical protein